MTQLRTRIGPDDHVDGPRDAPIQLVEYGDFECPYCGRAYFEVEKVRRALSGRLLFAYRHFPLARVHPRATLAAEAAEAAGAQGRFWEMHGLLFQNQPALEPTDLVADAAALGLDLDRFNDDLEEHRFLEKVRGDFMSGVRSGVNGTPTFFVNGHRHDGAFDAASLVEALEGGSPFTRAF
jgi:protein-disulfide isomerase